MQKKEKENKKQKEKEDKREAEEMRDAALLSLRQSALRDVSLSSGRETVFKPEQESAVRTLLANRDDLAVLRTGYGKSLIYQMFVRGKNYELNGNAAILVISQLKSIIEDQLQEMALQLILSPASKAKPVKEKKRASKLSAIEMLGTKNVRKANLKELESEQRKKEFEFQKQKYEETAAKRQEKLELELKERKTFLALLKNRLSNWH
ncbi:unnamed protein product [Porites evermanni]|uniref:DNA 3'-5' helicase n=1 Tax=Porites evermanni TaxID=104178 RepID=A0ABN8SVH9_9CNID|nr:unnamed protein product [Porites evermanni]